MARPGIQMWTWTLCVFLSWMCVGQAVAKVQYMVAIPAVIEAGAHARFCVNFLHPNETVVMTVTLKTDEKNTTLLLRTASQAFHDCVQFQAPAGLNDKVGALEVVVKGENFFSREFRKLLFRVYRPATFIQTDKPIYLPGQTVHFRVVTLDTELTPINQKYDIIEVEDLNGNRIGQWLNSTSSSMILQLSYSLNSEAREGSYKIIVTTYGAKINHRFKVEKYVLPKFDVEIKSLNEVSIAQEEIEAEVCAKYSYGQPVPASVKLLMCRKLSRFIYQSDSNTKIVDPCFEGTKKTDRMGCATFTVMMSTFTKIDNKALEDTMSILAVVEEEGTGSTFSNVKSMQISYVIRKLSFINPPKTYEKGSMVEGEVKAVYFNNTAIPDMPLHLLHGETWSSQILQNLTTDSNGKASFSFSTANLDGNIHIYISLQPKLEYTYRTPYYEVGEHTVSLAKNFSEDMKTVSSLEVMKKGNELPCDKTEDIVIKYIVVGEAKGSVNMAYLVLSRGSIIEQGLKHFEVDNKIVTKGEVSFSLMVSAAIAPEVQVVAYAILPSETVIANSAFFSIEKCFRQKVSMEFSPSSAIPGEETILHMTAQPDSLCGVSAVDQSVHIKEPGNHLKADMIYGLLPVIKASYIPYEIRDQFECLRLRHRRYSLPYPEVRDDAFTVFQNLGLKMATNLFIRMPSCLIYKGRHYNHGHGYGVQMYDMVPESSRMMTGGLSGPSGSVGHRPSDMPLILSVRTFFPETWIWELVEVGESGTKDVTLTVPDTITTWEAEAFCLSPGGISLAPIKKIKVFQPFFLELTLPYSIIRGEQFELKATVFNYLSTCIMVMVNPFPSSDYTLTPHNIHKYTSCLCGHERMTVSWTMAPSVLGDVNVTVSAEAVPSHTSCNNEIVSVPDRGHIDRVTRSLKVKAEGMEMSKNYNWLLCPNGTTLTEDIDIKLPENLIQGSEHASLSVLGDILGRALQNLDGLLKMPYGCGEQNMALLAPNIYVLEYLQNTNQLTPAIKEKAINFLISGYHRQLNYKHFDGAYSTFGSGSGNTWLTAFVLRSFAKAKSFIFIDPTKIEESKAWLEQKQKTNGCFEQLGNLFNNRMKGGVSDEVTLSAYITAAFLEMNVSVNDEVVKMSLLCLKGSIRDMNNTYTTALLAYVFTLAGDMETRAHLLAHLDSVVSKEGGFRHWSQTASDTSTSLSVEISSYVMLAKLSAHPTAEELGYASSIVRWVTGQQNYYGGFSSTQDTVVALQALALYATLVFSPDGSSTVTVQTPGSQLTFNVNSDNKLLYQEQELKDKSGKFNLEVKGNACASIQLSLHYNIPIPKEATTLSVTVQTEANCATTSTKPKLFMKFMSLYSGKENMTNMVILDIKLLSGFVPDPESLQKLNHALLVTRVEQKEDHILVYIEMLPQYTAIYHRLELVQEHLVEKMKPAVVEIYDYYQPSDKSETEYNWSCASGNQL